ncbi:MAG: hypothetical protein NUV77_19315 [Thermoguttaceae bacterium]|nr:hypothetical protein [Thermoguttaceae bacterium]
MAATAVLGAMVFCLPGCSWLVYCFLVPWCFALGRDASLGAFAVASFLCGAALVVGGCAFMAAENTGTYMGLIVLAPVALVAGGVNFCICSLISRLLVRRFGVPLALAALLCWLSFECNLRYVSGWVIEHGIPFVQIALAGPATEPLLRSAEIVGPLGVAAVVVLANVGLWRVLSKVFERTGGGAVSAGLCFVPLLLSLLRGVTAPPDEHTPSLSVAVVPGFVSVGGGAGLTIDAGALSSVDSGAAQACSLYVWGETALRDSRGRSCAIEAHADRDGVVVDAPSQQVGDALADLAQKLGAPLVLGALRRDPSESVHCRQSAFLVLPKNGITAFYDKWALAPILERPIPAMRWFVNWLGIRLPQPFSATSTLIPGMHPRSFLVASPDGTPRGLGVCLCYDLFFPEAFARYWYPAGTAPPDLFVVCAYHGLLRRGFLASCFERRCLAAAQLRAVETRRTILHVAIGGTTAVINRHGRILQRQDMPEPLKPVFHVAGPLSDRACSPACRSPGIVDGTVYLPLLAASVGWPPLRRVLRKRRLGTALEETEAV